MNKAKLLRLVPEGWNTRVFTEHDFYSLCALDSVLVVTRALPLPGAYCIYRNSPVIFLHRDLAGADRLQVQFHELGHHWLHSPGLQFFLGWESKCEFEANLISACALIPEPLLRSRPPGEIAEEYGYDGELIKFRLRVWDIYRL